MKKQELINIIENIQMILPKMILNRDDCNACQIKMDLLVRINIELKKFTSQSQQEVSSK